MTRTLEQIDTDLADLEATYAADTTPSRAELANKTSEVLDNWQAREEQFRAWMTGTITGGPNNDGYYPLSDSTGYTQLAACPAKLRDITEAPIQHITPSSSSQFVDVVAGPAARITLNAANLTLTVGSTIVDTAHELRLRLYLVQDATGGRGVTWPSNIMWSQQRPPILSVTPTYTDIIDLTSIDGGITWYGIFAGVAFTS
ncbi:hypothetical protein Sj15T_00420 [Sphingobium sp. TA15]|uniref:hypothetical protein n=1 Tax=Sphingobium TaxID=165695 RepID=UPI000368C76F|nr:hypothetical protein [Sphingobium indicum]EPR08511.1 hypothetical protein M527_09650 [Sphingobium indicum IP26]BDD65021.1 hypothetical protein Sj15T_00420 [Sphingobium sp. TA15]